MTGQQRRPPHTTEIHSGGDISRHDDAWESQETTQRIDRKAVLIEEKTSIMDTSTLLPRPEPTLAINVRALDLGASAPLPFREGPAIVPPISTTPSDSRMIQFTGTQSLSRAEVERAMAQAALPFEQSSAPPLPAAPEMAAPAFVPQAVVQPVLHDEFRTPLASPTTAPRKTIGETFATGAFSATTGSNAFVEPPKLFRAPVIAPEVRPDPVILLYLHRPAMTRIERKSTWQTIIDTLEEQPLDTDSDDPMLSNDPSEIIQQTRASAILKQGKISNRDHALSALETAAAKPGRFAPPLDLFEGELEVLFDEIESMRAQLTMLPASVQQDERASSLITEAKRLLESPDTTYALPLLRQVNESLRRALVAGKHIARPDELDALTSRSLLEKRHYQKSAVWGGEHLRAQFIFGESTESLLVYIPADASLLLPMNVRFRCRMIAEIHFSPDERDEGLCALRCLALGKVITPTRRA